MQSKNLASGNLGEEIATEFLRKKGYKIIGRNFRIRGGEIDIIAIENHTLVFIEVKTRTSNKFGTPLEAITPWKLKSLLHTLNFYKATHPGLPDSMRLDAVSIILNNQKQPLNIDLAKNIS